jgi:predicted dehydrogenase
MTSLTKQRLRFFERLPSQGHITDADKYLYHVPEPKYKLVIIGTGTIGQEHMYVATLLGRAQVHGIYDRSAHSMDVAERNFKAYSDKPLVRYASLHEACTDKDADAIMVCTPNYTHFDIFKTAIATGKPVFLEKPMATTLEHAAAMASACDDYSAPVQIGLQYRYKAQYVEALHEIAVRKAIGVVKTISLSEYRPPFLDKVSQWNKFSRYSGGTLIEKCCHYFDLMNLIADAKPERVYASGGRAVNFHEFEQEGVASDIDDHAFVIVDYQNGVRGNFTLNMFSHKFTEELIVCGDQGRLVASEVFDIHQRRPCEASISVELGEAGASRSTKVSYASDIEGSGHHGATFYEHQAFMDQLDGVQQSSATAVEGLWSVIVAAAAQQSIACGEPVIIEQFLETHNIAEQIKR